CISTSSGGRQEWSRSTTTFVCSRVHLSRTQRLQDISILCTKVRCSSANTLRIQRLEFGREQLTKGPDVIRHACRHRRCLLPPSGTNRPMACLLWLRQRLLQAHVGAGHIVEGLEKDHALPQPLAVFTKARRLPRQGGQGLPQGQVDPFTPSRAEAQTQTGQAFGAN